MLLSVKERRGIYFELLLLYICGVICLIMYIFLLVSSVSLIMIERILIFTKELFVLHSSEFSLEEYLINLLLLPPP
jgi:hypothetical protein